MIKSGDFEVNPSANTDLGSVMSFSTKHLCMKRLETLDWILSIQCVCSYSNLFLWVCESKGAISCT